MTKQEEMMPRLLKERIDKKKTTTINRGWERLNLIPKMNLPIKR